MTNYEEVRAFAREYINGAVTRERRLKIAEAYYRLTGDRLRITCDTCYIEAIFKIIKHMERKPCRYRLKKGAVLQAFGDESKFCTNDNLTDELAEWHIRNTRGALSLFSVMPEAPEVVEAATNLRIISPEAANKPKRSRSKTKR